MWKVILNRLQLYHEISHQTELELLKADLSVPVHIAHAKPVLDLECSTVSKESISILLYLTSSIPNLSLISLQAFLASFGQ